jgi:hypothetical protein
MEGAHKIQFYLRGGKYCRRVVDVENERYKKRWYSGVGGCFRTHEMKIQGKLKKKKKREF